MAVKVIVDTVAGWIQALDEALARDAVLLDVRRSIQLDGYSCGAQSGFMILRHFGKARSVTAVAKALRTDEDGTGTSELRDLFRRRGLKPVIKARATLADLRRGVDAGAPSLVSLGDGAHWGVVFGHAPGTIFLADPSMKIIRVRFSTDAFLRRWDRWAMIVHRR